LRDVTFRELRKLLVAWHLFEREKRRRVYTDGWRRLPYITARQVSLWTYWINSAALHRLARARTWTAALCATDFAAQSPL